MAVNRRPGLRMESLWVSGCNSIPVAANAGPEVCLLDAQVLKKSDDSFIYRKLRFYRHIVSLGL